MAAFNDSSALDDAAVWADRLTKIYGGEVRAVEDLSFTIRRGEIFGLLGPNGAGKTTTAGMLTTRVMPTSGNAWVGGVDVWRHPARAKRLIGVVPQANTLDRSLTVQENLFYHGLYFGMTRAAARQVTGRLLRQFELEKRANAPVAALSGGLAQRLMLARAIMHEPAVLFLDEPTTGLDPQSRLAFWNLLAQLNQSGQTVLLTTHYMEEAEHLCHRLAIIDRGTIIALDSPEGLRQAPGLASIITMTVSGGAAELARALRPVLPESARVEIVDQCVQVYVLSTEGLLGKLVVAAEQAGTVISDMTISRPSLESAYLQLTGKAWRDN